MAFQFDLRRRGWTLEGAGAPSSGCIGIYCTGTLDEAAWARVLALPEKSRRFVLVLAPATARERTMLIEAGFGDALTDAVELEELAARAGRLAEVTQWIPRRRHLGDLELDLLAREAYGQGKALNLNPREFALIWRLADVPGTPVSKPELIHDVWRMGFVPETNSIAVHMSRLRRKLGFVGMAGIIVTTSTGYVLTARRSGPVSEAPTAVALASARRPLAGPTSLGVAC
ncbi:winged helix-turn-helix domain-containing protein [Novosphingobium soli]|uniref:Winged helix-turn-helix domain-containing protein n=1 Tax=Novosphingobium soli TaxID=574956 RepID=A0ABV6CZ27_9SPHN